MKSSLQNKTQKYYQEKLTIAHSKIRKLFNYQTARNLDKMTKYKL